MTPPDATRPPAGGRMAHRGSGRCDAVPDRRRGDDPARGACRRAWLCPLRHRRGMDERRGRGAHADRGSDLADRPRHGRASGLEPHAGGDRDGRGRASSARPRAASPSGSARAARRSSRACTDSPGSVRSIGCGPRSSPSERCSTAPPAARPAGSGAAPGSTARAARSDNARGTRASLGPAGR